MFLAFHDGRKVRTFHTPCGHHQFVPGEGFVQASGKTGLPETSGIAVDTGGHGQYGERSGLADVTVAEQCQHTITVRIGHPHVGQDKVIPIPPQCRDHPVDVRAAVTLDTATEIHPSDGIQLHPVVINVQYPDIGQNAITISFIPYILHVSLIKGKPDLEGASTSRRTLHTDISPEQGDQP